MAVYQATNMAAISLPFGANHLPLDALPWLEKFERLYLWLDADEVGKTAAEKFAHKLGLKRCFLVNTTRNNPKGPKDANDALRAGLDLLQFIKDARPLIQENILTFKSIKDDVIKRILNYEQSKGILSNSFDWFNKKVKGFRKGELTVVTGGTGSGKTTLLSQLSLDFLEKGVPTIWGSFEIRNEVLASTMLMQFAKKNLIKNNESIELYAADFESLPLYFLKFYGSTPIDQILNTLDYSVYAYDIAHIVIDNLQFILSGQAKGIDKFDLQDSLISKLREFATNQKIHITIVIHPRKVDEEHQDISINSVFGSAKATQEADNVFILQNRHKYRHLDIRKNRFDGETGRTGLGYNRETRRFIELTDREVIQLNTTQKTVEDILNERIKQGDPTVVQGAVIAINKEVIAPKIKSKIMSMVDSDISYYGNVAKQTIAKGTQIVNSAIANIQKKIEIIPPPSRPKNEEILPDELEYEANNEEIIKTINKLIPTAAKTNSIISEKKKGIIVENPEIQEDFIEPPKTEIKKEEINIIKQIEKLPESKQETTITKSPEKDKNNSSFRIGVPPWADDVSNPEIQNFNSHLPKKKSYGASRTTKSDPSVNLNFESCYSVGVVAGNKKKKSDLYEVLKKGGYLPAKAKNRYGRSSSSSGKSSSSSTDKS